MNASLAAKALLADNPAMTLQELQSAADRLGLDPKAEDAFWAAARRQAPGLYCGW
ncbi:hypothetical protein ABZ917_17690 [Nonomuraea wenchangensis]